MRRDHAPQQLLGIHIREELVVVVLQDRRLECHRPQEAPLTSSSRPVVEVCPTPGQVSQVKVELRRPVVDLHEIGSGGDVPSLTAGLVVEPDIAAERIVLDAAHEKRLIRRLLRLRARRERDEQDCQKPRNQVQKAPQNLPGYFRSVRPKRCGLPRQQLNSHLENEPVPEEEVRCARAGLTATETAPAEAA